MKISFAITVCNELEEIKKLVPFLLENKRIQDEIVVLYDNENGNPEILDFLLPFNKLPNVQTWRGLGWNDNFAEWKNKLNEYCNGDYIFQLDADEIPNEILVANLKTILESNPVDLLITPRKNIVKGLTPFHVHKWGWKVSEQGWVNWPDAQKRIYKNNPKIQWSGHQVHGMVSGYETYATLPFEEAFSITHNKTIDRQENQNDRYTKIETGELK